MKLPFEFGIKLIFRLVLPGFLLTLGLYPAIITLSEDAGWTISVEYLLILSIIISGWLLLTLDQPIYMFLEGRRFWPRFVRALFIWIEQMRLKQIRLDEDKFYELSEISTGSKKQNYHQRYAEASVEKRRFPLDKNGAPEAKFPTRLGNLIDSYESYPKKRYGVNAIFYWYRIWLTLDKDLREELDNRQALADSAIYASVALFLSGLLWFVYWLLLGTRFGLTRHVPGTYALWLCLSFFVISYVMYRAALHPQAQYGESFKSVFDVYEKHIDVARIVDRVADLTHNPEVLNQTRQQQLEIAGRYLNNYTVKCPFPECSFRYPMSPEEFQTHYQAKHKVEPPAVAPAQPDFAVYRENLKRAYTQEKIILGIKILSVLSILLLDAGIYRDDARFAVAAIIVNLGLLSLESFMRRRQKTYTNQTFQFETSLGLPHIYGNPGSNYAKAAALLLPYVVVLLLALGLFLVIK